MTAADLVVTTLAAAEVELRSDRDAWRELALTSIQKIHDLTVENDRLRDQHRRLQGEYRALREQVLRETGATAA